MEFFLEKNLIYTEIQALPFTSIRGKGGGQLSPTHTPVVDGEKRFVFRVRSDPISRTHGTPSPTVPPGSSVIDERFGDSVCPRNYRVNNNQVHSEYTAGATKRMSRRTATFRPTAPGLSSAPEA